MSKSYEQGEFDFVLDDEGEFILWIKKKYERFSTYGCTLSEMSEKILQLYKYNELCDLLDTFDFLRKKILKDNVQYLSYKKETCKYLGLSLVKSDYGGGYVGVDSLVDWCYGKWEYARKQVPWFDEELLRYTVSIEHWTENEINRAFDKARKILEKRRQKRLQEVKNACDFVEETSKAWGYSSFKNPFKVQEKEIKPQEKNKSGFFEFLSNLFR